MISQDLYPLFFDSEKLGYELSYMCSESKRNGLSLLANYKINALVIKRLFDNGFVSELAEKNSFPFIRDRRVVLKDKVIELNDSSMSYDFDCIDFYYVKRFYENSDSLTYFSVQEIYGDALSDAITDAVEVLDWMSESPMHVMDELMDLDFTDPSSNFVIQFFFGDTEGLDAIVEHFKLSDEQKEELVKKLEKCKEIIVSSLSTKKFNIVDYVSFFEYESTVRAVCGLWDMVEEHSIALYRNQALEDWIKFSNCSNLDNGELEQRIAYLAKYYQNCNSEIVRFYLIEMDESEEEMPYEKETVYLQLWMKEVDEVLELLNRKYSFTNCEKQHFERYKIKKERERQNGCLV